MNISETLNDFLTTTESQTSISMFAFSLLLTVISNYILALCFQKYGSTFTDREHISKNFIIISLTTMIVISIVKSSLALSLGLVGALSIVRFRTAIKDPEELAYLFLSIAIGIGMGANQILTTLIGFVVVVMVLFTRGITKLKKETRTNLYVTISGDAEFLVDNDAIITTLQKYSENISLKSSDQDKNTFEMSFIVSFANYDNFKEAKNSLLSLDSCIRVSFLDSVGIPGC
jgi:uncharacterized membrane protein YhiD involved in acid resistance